MCPITRKPSLYLDFFVLLFLTINVKMLYSMPKALLLTSSCHSGLVDEVCNRNPNKASPAKREKGRMSSKKNPLSPIIYLALLLKEGRGGSTEKRRPLGRLYFVFEDACNASLRWKNPGYYLYIDCLCHTSKTINDQLSSFKINL